MKVQALLFVGLFLPGAFVSNAYAHHSHTATFTEEKSTTIEDVVTDFRFRNPHVLIYIDVSNEDGAVNKVIATFFKNCFYKPIEGFEPCIK